VGIWGALAKLNQLARTHVGRVARSTRTTTTARSTTGTTSNTRALDVAAVVKASQAISGEIVLERLLATLMDIIVENAGPSADHSCSNPRAGCWCRRTSSPATRLRA
jgi:hypothetical protein